MVVYGDLIFVINLLIDASLLLLTAWTRKKKLRLWRLALSSGMGGAYAVCMLYPELSGLYSFAFKLLFSSAMIAVAFGRDHPRQFARTVGAFYTVSFVAAGGVVGLHYFFMSSSDIWSTFVRSRLGGSGFTLSVQLPFIVLVFIGSGWLYLRLFQNVKQQQTISAYMADVQVSMDDFELTCRGLVDTGNQLYDPLTRTPVMVMEAEGWKDVLPDAWIKQIREADVDRIISEMGEGSFKWQDRLRLVPYRGVNRSTSFMLAIKPDQVRISLGDKQLSASRVLIGFDGGKLSSDGAYQAIIHPALLEA